MKDSQQEPQPDLFADEFDKPRLFDCIAGYYVGTFNRNADPAAEDASHINRLSVFMRDRGEAEAVLASGQWTPAEPEIP
jgi:hypothetical protein